MLVAHALGLKWSAVHLEPHRLVNPDEQTRALQLAGQRERRVPLQYIIGQCEFMSLPFVITQGVFIPRPETEVLVESLIGEVSKADCASGRILDLGAGSGVVGISLAKYLKPDFVLACDVSPLAVEISRKNAILNCVHRCMGFVIGDGTSYIGSEADGCGHEGFDVVACNPPYVESGQIEFLEPEVRDHDPRLAIDGGTDGLSFIEGITPGLPSILREGAVVGFEIGATHGERVRALFEGCGLTHVRVHKDLNGRDRVVLGRNM